MTARQPSRKVRERYDFADSPWSQNLTQRDLAELIRCKKSQLETLVSFKDAWIIRRTAIVGRKTRKLAYPYGRLRWVHDRIKFHLNKIRQPVYLYSPRGGRAQRDNAALHVGQNHFLTLDICQFYPSTTSEHVFRWAHYTAGLRPDVAGLFTKLVTVDDRISFGSPLSPVLATLVHRAMFDAIHAACVRRGLRMSLWVDDLTISGRFIPGELLIEVRDIISKAGLKSHKVQFRSGARPVTVTGIPVSKAGLIVPRSLHQKVQDGFTLLRMATDDAERIHSTSLLLSHLGTLRYNVGPGSPMGRRAADLMNMLRQRRRSMELVYRTEPTLEPTRSAIDDDGSPF